MKAIEENLYIRGKNGVAYCRRRIPKAILEAYPKNKTHLTCSLHTSDIRMAKGLLKAEINRMDAEFAAVAKELKEKRAARARQRLDRLSEEQLKSLADYWVRQILLSDDRRRSEGLDDDEFDELDMELHRHRDELGRMLAMGRTEKILPAMHGFIHLCGLDVEMSPEEAKRAGGVFLRAVVTALDHQLHRQSGQLILTDVVAPPCPAPKDVAASKAVPVISAGPTWDEVFAVWRDFVPGRPKSTAIATQTPWLELQRIASEEGVSGPGHVTPELMRRFVDRMSERLAVVTLNERLAKIKSLFRVVKGKGILPTNPAADTLGLKESSFAKRKKRRLPFDELDLTKIFTSSVFNEQQLRSQGQSGEATYWIPVLMHYTGARTEEIAGLALSDIVQDQNLGWYFNIVDRPSPEDDLFDEPASGVAKGAIETEAQWRTLKNAKSIRKVPMAGQLVELGLFRYMNWLRQQGHQSLFPTLQHDWHGKLSGAFSKFFGRFKAENLGITSPKKVLYSFRHNMKDAMEEACLPSKYLKRILGHASGDGDVTDGYGGQDVPLHALVKEFNKIQFFQIPAQPWMPGKGFVKYLKPKKNRAQPPT